MVNVYDVTNTSEPLIMYGPPYGYMSVSHVSMLDFGDPFRKHEMKCRLANSSSYACKEMFLVYYFMFMS